MKCMSVSSSLAQEGNYEEFIKNLHKIKYEPQTMKFSLSKKLSKV